VMGIDVDIGNALQAVLAAQPFDQHPAIVQSAEPGCTPSCGVMEACDGHKGATGSPLHDLGACQ